MTTTSLLPAVIDYLVTTCTASAALGAASPAVVVVDGPNVTEDLLANQRLLWIGYDRLNPAEPAAAAGQDWPVLDAARTVDEDGEITCSAQFWSGDTTVKPNRDGCAAIVEAVAALLRGTPAAGGGGDTTMGGLVRWSRAATWVWAQRQQNDGTAVLCVFKIVYQGRNTV